MPTRRHHLVCLIGASLMGSAQAAACPNQVLGTWRMVSAQIDPDGRNRPAYGRRPNGLLSFTPDLHDVEVLTDAGMPRFASDQRGHGTDAENRAAMAGGVGFFGTYAVDADGAFLANDVRGSTFPNWVGDVRTRERLRLVVEGDRMTETFTRPGGTRIVIRWQRVL